MISILQIPVFTDCQIGKVSNWLGIVGSEQQQPIFGVAVVQGLNEYIDFARFRKEGDSLSVDSEVITTNGIDLYFPSPYSVAYKEGACAISCSETAGAFQYVVSAFDGYGFDNEIPQRKFVDALNGSSVISCGDKFIFNIYEQVDSSVRSNLHSYTYDQGMIPFGQSGTLLTLGVNALNSSACQVGSDAIYAYSCSGSDSPIFYIARKTESNFDIYGNFTLSDTSATRVSVGGNKIGSNFCIQYFIESEARIVYGEFSEGNGISFGEPFTYTEESASHGGCCVWNEGTTTAFSAVPIGSGFDIFFHSFSNFEPSTNLVGSIQCPPQNPVMCEFNGIAYLGYIDDEGIATVAVITSGQAGGDVFWTNHTLQKE